MDKQEKINELFRFAREEQPNTSFEETRDSFLNSLKNQSPKIKNKKSINLKNWLIMGGLFLTITTLFFVFLNIKDTNPTNIKTKSTFYQTKKDQNTRDHFIRSKEVLEVSGIPEKQNTVIQNDVNTASNRSFGFEEINIPGILHKYQELPFDDTLKTNTPGFPELSAKMIKNNTRKKNEMLKAFLKRDIKVYAYLPSGNIEIGDEKRSVQAFYMQKTEVTNLEYRTFLYDLLIQGKKEEYLKAAPDEQMWFKLFGKGMADLGNLYFTHPSYNNYPVCNITQEGAEMYCKWLLEETTEKYPDKNLDYQVARLPIRTEWIYAASSRGKNKVYPWGTDSTRNEAGEYLANYKPVYNNFHLDGGFHSIMVTSYNPTEFGLYNMCGNVCELVYNLDFSLPEPWKHKTVGTAGGGWMDTAEDIKILAKDPFEGKVSAHPAIGFRVCFTHIGR